MKSAYFTDKKPQARKGETNLKAVNKEKITGLKGRILILVENLSVPFDRRVWQEARALREAGCEVSVICPKMIDRKTYEIVEGINIYRYPLPIFSGGFLSYALEYTWAMICTILLSQIIFYRKGFEIIHACNPPDLFFILGLIYKPLGVKFVYDQHDLCPEVYDSRFGKNRGFVYTLLMTLEKLTYKTADMVIATNDSYKSIAITRGGKNPEKVAVVRSSPSLREFQYCEPEAQLKQGKKHLVAYLGTMAPQDGVEYLIKSIHYIVNSLERKDIQFVLIGSGDSFDYLNSLSNELHLADFVKFTGRIPDNMLRKYLCTADICVAPDPLNTLNDVSTMNKILEYMAMQKPMVSYDLKETRKSAGHASLYARDNNPVDFALNIIKLIENPELRNVMGKYGFRRLSSKLSWDNSRNNLIEVYSQMLKK